MKRILVVEDDPITMNLIVILLEREGYEVAQSFSAFLREISSFLDKHARAGSG
jgi:CheY-like chemotaxis protein